MAIYATAIDIKEPVEGSKKIVDHIRSLQFPLRLRIQTEKNHPTIPHTMSIVEDPTTHNIYWADQFIYKNKNNSGR